MKNPPFLSEVHLYKKMLAQLHQRWPSGSWYYTSQSQLTFAEGTIEMVSISGIFFYKILHWLDHFKISTVGTSWDEAVPPHLAELGVPCMEGVAMTGSIGKWIGNCGSDVIANRVREHTHWRARDQGSGGGVWLTLNHSANRRRQQKSTVCKHHSAIANMAPQIAIQHKIAFQNLVLPNIIELLISTWGWNWQEQQPEDTKIQKIILQALINY
jgi:hypothetical protein